MKQTLIVVCVVALSGCATVDNLKKYWPRDHDPVMLNQLVTVEQDLNDIDCKNPNWTKVIYEVNKLDRYVALRQDPQQENIHGLQAHIQRMSTNSNPTFCDLGKKTGKSRIDAALSAWKGR